MYARATVEKRLTSFKVHFRSYNPFQYDENVVTLRQMSEDGSVKKTRELEKLLPLRRAASQSGYSS